MSTIKAVLFDFDETLHDRTLAFDDYVLSFLNHFFPNISDEEKKKRAEDMVSLCGGGYTQGNDYYNTLKSRWYWKDAPDNDFLIDYYNVNFPYFIKVYQNSKTVLEKLKKDGYIVGVLTNGPSNLQHKKLELSGLLDFCDFLVVSGDVGIHKPDPQIFKYVAEKYNLNIEDCVYVGDHPENDINASLKAGMKAVRMNVGWFKNCSLRDDVPNIDDIAQVLEVVKRY